MILKELDVYDLRGGIYVDVGANHPTSISNTFLLYRHGLHGVTIEPNPELSQLHRRFRRRDVVVSVGCGRRAQMAVFEISKTPVLSRFQSAVESVSQHKMEVMRREYLPILPLDIVLAALAFDWIYFLSIDVEGLDVEVLQGAGAVLPKTLFLCVEANSAKERAVLSSHLQAAHFDLQTTLGCNLIFKNSNPRFDAYRVRPSAHETDHSRPAVAVKEGEPYSITGGSIGKTDW
jgi:FkbM family methyltransferase